MATQFSAEEVAAVLATALLGLDDDAPPPRVVILLPDGERRELAGVWHERATNELIVDLTDEGYDGYDVFANDWLARAWSTLPGRRRRSPLRGITVDDVASVTDEPKDA